MDPGKRLPHLSRPRRDFLEPASGTGLSCFGPHGHELFRRRRVNADGSVELRLSGAAVERHGKTLDDLTGLGPEYRLDNFARALLPR